MTEAVLFIQIAMAGLIWSLPQPSLFFAQRPLLPYGHWRRDSVSRSLVIFDGFQKNWVKF